MTCKCGKEIENVPEHLSHLVSWVCKDCSNTPPASSLVGLTASGNLSVEEIDVKKLKAGQAA